MVTFVTRDHLTNNDVRSVAVVVRDPMKRHGNIRKHLSHILRRHTCVRVRVSLNILLLLLLLLLLLFHVIFHLIHFTSCDLR